MLVDSESVVLALKERLLTKHSWGQRELLALVVELEVKHRQDERPSDTLFRLYGTELEELFFDRIPRSRTADTPATTSASLETDGMHERSAPSSDHRVPKEDPCQIQAPPPSRSSSERSANATPLKIAQ